MTPNRIQKLAAILSLLLLSQAACRSEAPPPTVPDPPPLLRASFGVFPESLVLRVGEEGAMRAIVNWPRDTTVDWSTAPESVAVVSNTGRVRALRAGSATVRGFLRKEPMVAQSRSARVIP